MCKILLVTGIQDSPLSLEFMKRMAKPMSTNNRDGIGYTAVKPNGDIFSQRFHNNESFLDLDSIMTPEISKKLQKFKHRLPAGALDLNYSQYGEIDFSDVKTLTMHTRFATCEKTMANVHPFIDQDISLVHNGVIRNSDFLKVNKISTCDSEAALQTYITEGVLNDSSKAKRWLDILSGSWAFGVLGRNDSGNRILDVVRGTSFLYYLEAGPLGRIFTTNDSDATAVLKDMGIEVTLAPELVKADTMYRFDALTGEMIEQIDVKPVYQYSGIYYQGGRTFGTSHSSTHRMQNASRMTQKDLEYNAAIMADAMGQANDDGDFVNANGDWDFRKVAKFNNNRTEPFIDRLDMFDLVFNDDLSIEFELLPLDLRDYVKSVDSAQSFKAARKLIRQLVSTARSNTMG